ncbi:O-antigen polymerase [Geobacillus sp. ZGt-1]|uniref:O-antigen polymerase n=1 Tax=Geobacillus sp. ZGt-1 TaxID=1631556 RepID=UPI0006493764|nr:O-antigen polymerase [Geobacillus sp. ZGt-1]
MLDVLIWLIVLVASTLMFRYAAGTLSWTAPNLVSIVYYYSFLLSSFIGALLIALGMDDYYMIRKLFRPEEYRQIGFFVVSFVMIVFPLSMVVVSRLCGFEARQEFRAYLQKPLSPLAGATGSQVFYAFLALSLLSFAAIAYMIWKTPTIPVFALLTGTDESLAALRIEASRHFAGNVLVRNIFAITLTPLLSFIAYLFAELTHEWRWKQLFICLFVGAVFVNVYDLAKSPIFFYVMMFFLIRIYIGKTRLSAVKLALYGGVGAAVLVGMYIVIQGVQDATTFLSYNKGPIGRMILAQIAPTFLHLNLFGEALPFLYGKSLPSILTGLFDVENVRSARLVMAHVFPERIEDGTGGVLNTLFVAEAYANFGYVGIVIGTLYVAVVTQLLYIGFLRLPKNPLFLSLFVYFSINIPRTLVGGFTDFLFNPTWVLLVALFGGMALWLRVQGDLRAWFATKRRITDEG